LRVRRFYSVVVENHSLLGYDAVVAVTCPDVFNGPYAFDVEDYPFGAGIFLILAHSVYKM